MEKRKVLGRGLETLLPSSRHSSSPAAAAVAPGHGHGEVMQEIPVRFIDRNPYQTRSKIDQAALAELTASVKQHGVLQPITVRPLPEGRFQLIAGERRWLASTECGKSTVPALVRQVSDQQAMEMTIIENLQREDLNPMEEARAFERLAREFHLTQDLISLRTGKDRSSIANYLRLLKLPSEVQQMIEAGDLSFGHGKVLMALDSPGAITELARRVAALGLSVRETEKAVTNLIHPPEKAEKVRIVDPNVKEAEKTLRQALGIKVTITDRKGKGKILLEYSSLEDFDRIVEMLGSK